MNQVIEIIANEDETEVDRLKAKVTYLQEALNRQTARCNNLARSRRRNWHRAEAAESYARHLALQVDDAAALLDDLLHLSPVDELQFLENGQVYLHQIEEMYTRLWGGRIV